MRTKVLLALAALLVILPLTNTRAENTNCKDILILFARGSGQNPSHKYLNDVHNKEKFGNEEEQSYTFFEEIDKRVTGISKEYISLHDFGGRYNNYGYQAVGVWDGFRQGPAHRTDVPNKYYESVKDGAEELAWFLEDRLTSCPFQQVILGGYSQGAQVVGDALFMMQTRFRPRINYVALYGDPKFNPRTSLIPITTGPWVRGNAWSIQSGVLGTRKNYLPDEIANKGSWCDFSDPICANYFGQNPITTTLTDIFVDKTHQNIYQGKWIPQSANEIANTLRKNSVLSKNVQTTQWVNKNDKLYQTDLAIVIDTSGSMSTEVVHIRAVLDSFVTSLMNSYWDIRVGIVGFNDLVAGLPYGTPSYYSKVLSDFTYDKESIKNTLNTFKVGGGGDEPEAMYSGLMTAMDTSQMHWRSGAQKKIIVITDAPAKDPDPGPNHYTKQNVIDRALRLDPVSVSLTALPRFYPWPYTNTILNQQVENNFNSTVRDIISATNGVTTEGNWDYKVEYVTNTLDKMIFLPVAAINGLEQGYVGTPVLLSGGDSYDPDSSIKEYAWDCNNDGTWDYTSPNPNAECNYNDPYNDLIVLEVRSEDGGSAKAILNITITNQIKEQSLPDQPAATAARDGSNVNIAWPNYPSDVFMRILDDNEVIEVTSGINSYRMLDAPQGTFSLSLAACNQTGCSQPTILRIPGAPTPSPAAAPTPIATPTPNVIQDTTPITPVSLAAAATNISQPVADNAVLTSVEGIKITTPTPTPAKTPESNASTIIDALIILVIALGAPWLIMKRLRLRQ